MKITLLIPCYNEEKTIRKSIESWLNQTRLPDEIIVVDDSSNDGCPVILDEYSDRILVRRTPKNLGNKSHAQEYGLQFVTGDIFVSTDADTLLHPKFIEHMERDFTERPEIAAVAGYVCSLPQNNLTACRALDYIIAQNIDKLAQNTIDFMFVIPGAAGAFRTDLFRQHIKFDHDTLTEDLDFTYKLNELDLRIHYNREAICYTQDPSSFHSYINQMRRWYGGGWQNLVKHFDIPNRPWMALEISLTYSEGLIFSAILLALPFVNILYSVTATLSYAFFGYGLAMYAFLKEDRKDVFSAIPLYVVLRYINSWIFVEQFVKEVILRRRNLTWFKPDRVHMQT